MLVERSVFNGTHPAHSYDNTNIARYSQKPIHPTSQQYSFYHPAPPGGLPDLVGLGIV